MINTFNDIIDNPNGRAAGFDPIYYITHHVLERDVTEEDVENELDFMFKQHRQRTHSQISIPETKPKDSTNEEHLHSDQENSDSDQENSDTNEEDSDSDDL